MSQENIRETQEMPLFVDFEALEEPEVRETQDMEAVVVFQEPKLDIRSTQSGQLSIPEELLEDEDSDLTFKPRTTNYMRQTYGFEEMITPMEDFFAYRLDMQIKRVVSVINGESSLSPHAYQRISTAVNKVIEQTYNTVSGLFEHGLSANDIKIGVEEISVDLLEGLANSDFETREADQLGRSISRLARSIEVASGNELNNQDKDVLREALFSICDGVFAVFGEYGGDAGIKTAQTLRSLYEDEYQALQRLTQIIFENKSR